MDTYFASTRWQFCRIERIVTRARWPGARRRGAFIATLRDGARKTRYLSRSAYFTVPSPTDADIAAFHALLAVLREDGWQPWRGPDVPLGIDGLNRGYWNVVLRRPLAREEALDMTPSRKVGDPAMEELRQRAIARLREERDLHGSPVRTEPPHARSHRERSQEAKV